MTTAAPLAAPSLPSTLLADYDFVLPPEAIAQRPCAQRDAARLLVLHRSSDARTHSHVAALPTHLDAGDLIVVNDTRVLRARVRVRLATGAAGELLVLEPVAAAADAPADSCVWRCLGKPGKRMRPGARLTLFGDREAEVEAVQPDGRVDVRFPVADIGPFLDAFGEIPLPPYIRRDGGPTTADADRYQTMFASEPGSVAAPTAGLHFTEELVAALGAAGVEIARVTLHVGPATFLPVRAADAREHRLLPERYAIPPETATAIATARRRGGRVVAIGTTTTRALESAAAADGSVAAGQGWADRFLYPGQSFRVIDALFTNFHLPRSTLLLLVCAFAGRDVVLEAYAEAVASGYRFYSYGDAMLIR